MSMAYQKVCERMKEVITTTLRIDLLAHLEVHISNGLAKVGIEETHRVAAWLLLSRRTPALLTKDNSHFKASSHDTGLQLLGVQMMTGLSVAELCPLRAGAVIVSTPLVDLGRQKKKDWDWFTGTRTRIYQSLMKTMRTAGAVMNGK